MARIAVVGGGLGGLSAAVHLAVRGERVVLFEKNRELGGKAGRREAHGFTFDTGPSLLTMPETLDELFAAAGEERAKWLEIERLPVQCRYLFDDGAQLDLCDDREETLRNVRALAGEDAAGFGSLLHLARRIHEITGRPFLEEPFEGFARFGRVMASRGLEAIRYGMLQGTLADVARRELSSERLRWILERYATYAGGGPTRSPAAFAMILDIESRGGAFYPRGGIRSIVEAVGRLARHVGVEVRTGCEVDEIEVRERAVRGVRVDGEREEFDAVVCNADPVFAAKHLLSPEIARAAGLDGHLRQELGLSGVVLLLGVRGRLPHLAHHTVLFPRRYAEEFTDLFTRHDVPRDPTVYLCIPSRTDETRAPPGDESVFCMINAPATSGVHEWSSRRGELEELIVSTVERRAIPDLRHRMAFCELIGPDELRQRFHAPGGSIYGVSPHGRMSPFHRPRQRVEGLRGLYFTGGGTHPGGGIPLVLRSGKFAARLVHEDLARFRPTMLAEVHP